MMRKKLILCFNDSPKKDHLLLFAFKVTRKEGKEGGRKEWDELVGHHFLSVVTDENSDVLDSIFRMRYMSTETCKSSR